MRFFNYLLKVAYLAPLVLGDFDIGYEDDSDLTRFVTRPDIKAPILNVTMYDEDAVLPGKWFIAPYTEILQHPYPKKYYQPCQSGPHIYDLHGELIWSGACKFRNQNAYDFRVFDHNGSQFMSGILHKYMEDHKGHAFIMDNHYQVALNIQAPEEFTHFNMHDLKISSTKDGRMTVIYLTHRVQLEDVEDLELDGMKQGYVGDTGFHEIDMSTGNLVFEWWPADFIPLTEGTTASPQRLKNSYPAGWNWFHANSLEKNSDGDYLVCSRFTDAIYKVSGEDGDIIWQLGGKSNDFEMEGGWSFSRQHDAQWIYFDEHKEIISMLDNGGDGEAKQTANTSSALFVELDKDSKPPIARVLKRIWRPDGRMTEARGNFQRFAPHSDNVLVGWSENNYMTEHDGAGNMLLEARFLSSRMVSYRSYKFNFTGDPLDPPDIKVFVYGESSATATTVAYMSWNGATEVSTWNLYTNGTNGTESPVLIGSKSKTGFETVLQKQGYYGGSVYAEALNSDGTVLGRTEYTKIHIPNDWTTNDQSVNPTNPGNEEEIEQSVLSGSSDQEAPIQEPIWKKTDL